MKMTNAFLTKAKAICAVIAVWAAAQSIDPSSVSAAQLRNVSCSVAIDYSLSNIVRAQYQREIIIQPGLLFEDDFSTAVRFRYLDAITRLEADGKTTTVTLSYYNDVGVFEFIDFRTELKLKDDRVPVTTAGSHTYWSSLGVAGEHTTDYAITCAVLKD